MAVIVVYLSLALKRLSLACCCFGCDSFLGLLLLCAGSQDGELVALFPYTLGHFLETGLCHAECQGCGCLCLQLCPVLWGASSCVLELLFFLPFGKPKSWKGMSVILVWKYVSYSLPAPDMTPGCRWEVVNSHYHITGNEWKRLAQ